MKQGTISVNAVENGYTITLSAQHETNQPGVNRAINRLLVATSDADAKKKLHEMVDDMFEPPKEPAKAK